MYFRTVKAKDASNIQAALDLLREEKQHEDARTAIEVHKARELEELKRAMCLAGIEGEVVEDADGFVVKEK